MAGLSAAEEELLRSFSAAAFPRSAVYDDDSHETAEQTGPHDQIHTHTHTSEGRDYYIQGDIIESVSTESDVESDISSLTPSHGSDSKHTVEGGEALSPVGVSTVSVVFSNIHSANTSSDALVNDTRTDLSVSPLIAKHGLDLEDSFSENSIRAVIPAMHRLDGLDLDLLTETSNRSSPVHEQTELHNKISPVDEIDENGALLRMRSANSDGDMNIKIDPFNPILLRVPSLKARDDSKVRLTIWDAKRDANVVADDVVRWPHLRLERGRNQVSTKVNKALDDDLKVLHLHRPPSPVINLSFDDQDHSSDRDQFDERCLPLGADHRQTRRIRRLLNRTINNSSITHVDRATSPIRVVGAKDEPPTPTLPDPEQVGSQLSELRLQWLRINERFKEQQDRIETARSKRRQRATLGRDHGWRTSRHPDNVGFNSLVEQSTTDHLAQNESTLTITEHESSMRSHYPWRVIAAGDL